MPNGRSNNRLNSEVGGAGIDCPSRLPLLASQVLLPAVIARITVSSQSLSSVALLQHLSTQSGTDVFVAVVPEALQDSQNGSDGKRASARKPSTLPAKHATESKAIKRQPSHDTPTSQETQEAKTEVQLNAIGTAARVLQVTHSIQNGSWTIVLEGLCRVQVSQPVNEAPFASCYVQQLDGFHPSDSRYEGVDQMLTKPAAETLAELQTASRQLLGLLAFTAGGPAARKLADLLMASSPGRCADLLASVLATAPVAQLSMLNAVDVGKRLSLALELVKDALSAAGQAIGALGDGTTFSGTGGNAKTTAAAQLVALQKLQNVQAAAQGRLPGLPPIQGGRPRRSDGSRVEQDNQELLKLAQQLESAEMPPDVHKVAMKELKRLERTNEQQPGYAVTRTYLETLADLPWNRFASRPLPSRGQLLKELQGRHTATTSAGSVKKRTPTPTDEAQLDPDSPAVSTDSSASHREDAPGQQPSDACEPITSEDVADGEVIRTSGHSLEEARALLDRNHYGLEKVKERIIQYLAVMRLKAGVPSAASPTILALVGPPGVGKTSLASSISAALGRPMQRISLGGVRDEAEIRGHRRTYIGALPGRVIQAARKAGVRDALLLFDEVDKMGSDSRGNPSAALLEVLDPEQNATFTDSYLGVPFDLSQIVFLATCNTLATIPPPLLDRLEVIRLSGYTLDEKMHIGMRHLVPKLLEEHGLDATQLQIPLPIMRSLARGYTREAGVRSLTRALAAICRHVAVDVVSSAETGADSTSPDHSSDSCVPPAHQTADTAEHTSPLPASVSDSCHDVGSLQPQLGCSGPSGDDVASWQSRPCPTSCLTAASSCRAVPHLTGLHDVRAVHDWSDGCDIPPCRSRHMARIPAILADAGPRGSAMSRVVVDTALLEEVLGPPPYGGNDAESRVANAGSVAGLVWTEAGGQVQYVECIATGARPAGTAGSLTLTGQVGEVLQESSRIALSWVRAHFAALERDPQSIAASEGQPSNRLPTAVSSASAAQHSDRHNPMSWDVHLHLPAGAVQKDGPSAGVTLATALASLYTGCPVRADTAMTGELTLRGLVLPVGGIKDKLIAAHEAGLTRVIIPKSNTKNVEADLPPSVRAALHIIPAARMETVLSEAFDPPLSLQHVSRL